MTVRKYTHFADIKADEYGYWQSRPVHERMDAVEEMIETAYSMKSWELKPPGPRDRQALVRLHALGGKLLFAVNPTNKEPG